MAPPIRDEAPGDAGPADHDDHVATGWRYDSFYLRVWHTAGGERFHRVEVQHLQTGLIETALDPALDWVLGVILGSLTSDDPMV